MWHIRTQDWWRKALPDFEITFGGPKHAQGNYNMGIWGIKK
jgi:hypothetical protein